ncbi:MAG: hypothetical protein WA820_25650 [Bradyrhizobium sp.]
MTIPSSRSIFVLRSTRPLQSFQLTKLISTVERDRNGRTKAGNSCTTNKVTALAKDAIAAAADRLGGVDRLVAWVREDSSNERVFWGQIYTKLLPLQVAGDSEVPLVSKLIVEWQPSSE